MKSTPSSRTFTKQSSYEIPDFLHFVTYFEGLVLDDQKELEKNKIYGDYLLLEKTRFPGSFVV